MSKYADQGANVASPFEQPSNILTVFFRENQVSKERDLRGGHINVETRISYFLRKYSMKELSLISVITRQWQLFFSSKSIISSIWLPLPRSPISACQVSHTTYSDSVKWPAIFL